MLIYNSPDHYSDPLQFISPKLYSDEFMNSKMGEFFDLSHYHYLFDTSADVFTTDKELLFSLRKQIIPLDLCRQGLNSFKDAVKRSKTNNRGVASGKVDLTQIPGNVIGITSPNQHRTNIIFSDGSISNYKVGNSVYSMIAGYYDQPIRSHKVDLPASLPCRTTAFSRDYVNQWTDALPLIKHVDQFYAQLLPNKYREQKQLADSVPDFVIDSTIFSTLTINYNWRTAAHIDKGDYCNGYSAIIVCEEGEWTGCYLGYPQYGVCVNVRQGDLLLLQPHQVHCNTELTLLSTDSTRLSIVMYFREGMIKCSSSEAVQTLEQRAKHVV